MQIASALADTRKNLTDKRDFGLYQRDKFSQLDSDGDVKRIARVVDGRRHQVVRLVLAVEQMFQQSIFVGK